MKKKLMIITGSALALGIAFGAGNLYTKAADDWQTNAINNAQAELSQSANNKATDLADSAGTDINAKINAQVNDELKQKQDELNQLLEQYYQMKLAGLTDSQQYKDLETQIENIKNWAFDQYKYKIDQAFATQTK